MNMRTILIVALCIAVNAHGSSSLPSASKENQFYEQQHEGTEVKVEVKVKVGRMGLGVQKEPPIGRMGK